jgi:hypothetical protein
VIDPDVSMHHSEKKIKKVIRWNGKKKS